MNDDDEQGEPAPGSASPFDEGYGPPAQAAGRSRWTAQDILVRIVIATIILLVMIGALLVILRNVFNVLSS